ncbi:conserved domain protein [Trichinella spiralis]|uniref:hypothetical protein n=1 Tax=Trichinella spiralis TaxID=6334 RepID=UPI0001EFC8D8|nr:conserved domain protein [Trichinella spiralis]
MELTDDDKVQMAFTTTFELRLTPRDSTDVVRVLTWTVRLAACATWLPCVAVFLLSYSEAESSSTDEEDVSDYLDQEEDLITSSKLATYETGVKVLAESNCWWRDGTFNCYWWCSVLVSCRSWRNLLCWLSVARCNAHLKRTFGAVDHLVRKYVCRRRNRQFWGSTLNNSL